jgi:hypothetical protein
MKIFEADIEKWESHSPPPASFLSVVMMIINKTRLLEGWKEAGRGRVLHGLGA